MTHQLTNLRDIAITRNLTVAFDTIILIDANCAIKTSADGTMLKALVIAEPWKSTVNRANIS